MQKTVATDKKKYLDQSKTAGEYPLFCEIQQNLNSK